MDYTARDDGTLCGAVISEDGTYRYVLERTWDPDLPIVIWIMLNPSTADATNDDPTIKKCIGFAKLWGFGGIRVLNLWAYRATKPIDLALHLAGTTGLIEQAKRATAQAANLNYIKEAILATPHVPLVVVAWGASDCVRHHIEQQMLRVLEVVYRAMGQHGDRRVECLGRTKTRQPRHPLMLAYNTKREVF